MKFSKIWKCMWSLHNQLWQIITCDDTYKERKSVNDKFGRNTFLTTIPDNLGDYIMIIIIFIMIIIINKIIIIIVNIIIIFIFIFITNNNNNINKM